MKMANCARCQRTLNQGEDGLCPACKSKKNRRVKLAVQIGFTLLAMLGTAAKAFYDFKGGGGSAAGGGSAL